MLLPWQVCGPVELPGPQKYGKQKRIIASWALFESFRPSFRCLGSSGYHWGQNFRCPCHLLTLQGLCASNRLVDQPIDTVYQVCCFLLATRLQPWGRDCRNHTGLQNRTDTLPHLDGLHEPRECVWSVYLCWNNKRILYMALTLGWSLLLKAGARL